MGGLPAGLIRRRRAAVGYIFPKGTVASRTALPGGNSNLPPLARALCRLRRHVEMQLALPGTSNPFARRPLDLPPDSLPDWGAGRAASHGRRGVDWNRSPSPGLSDWPGDQPFAAPAGERLPSVGHPKKWLDSTVTVGPLRSTSAGARFLACSDLRKRHDHHACAARGVSRTPLGAASPSVQEDVTGVPPAQRASAWCFFQHLRASVPAPRVGHNVGFRTRCMDWGTRTVKA